MDQGKGKASRKYWRPCLSQGLLLAFPDRLIWSGWWEAHLCLMGLLPRVFSCCVSTSVRISILIIHIESTRLWKAGTCSSDTAQEGKKSVWLKWITTWKWIPRLGGPDPPAQKLFLLYFYVCLRNLFSQPAITTYNSKLPGLSPFIVVVVCSLHRTYLSNILRSALQDVLKL